MAHDLNEGKKRLVTVAYTRADGSAGEVEGFPVWESSDLSLMSVAVEADGMSAHVHWVAEGSATLTVTADADLSADKEFPLVVTHEFTTLAGLGAVSGELVIGDEISV